MLNIDNLKKKAKRLYIVEQMDLRQACEKVVLENVKPAEIGEVARNFDMTQNDIINDLYEKLNNELNIKE